MSIDDDGIGHEASVQTTLAAIFFSMELSRSSWLITSLSPGQGEKMSRKSLPAGDFEGLRSLLTQISDKGLASTIPSSRSKKLGLTASGFTDCSSKKVSRAISWIRPRSRHLADGAERKPTSSTVRHFCGRCSPTSAVIHGYARWLVCLRRRRKIAVVSVANG